MTQSCETHICKALQICAEMLALAQRGLSECDHEGCILLSGMIFDSAHEIQRAASKLAEDLGIHLEPRVRENS